MYDEDAHLSSSSSVLKMLFSYFSLQNSFQNSRGYGISSLYAVRFPCLSRRSCHLEISDVFSIERSLSDGIPNNISCCQKPKQEQEDGQRTVNGKDYCCHDYCHRMLCHPLADDILSDASGSLQPEYSCFINAKISARKTR